MLLGIVLLAAAPFAPRGIAMLVAGVNGCTLDDNAVHACVIAGADRGDLLHLLFVSLWLIIFSIPLAGLALMVWYAVLMIVYYGTRRRTAV